MLRDIRHALRLLARAPGLTSVAVLSIALSTGATAVVFAAIKAVLIQPLPYAHPEELVQIQTSLARVAGPPADWVSWKDMQDVLRDNHSLSSLGTWRYAMFNLAAEGDALPEALYGLKVDPRVLPTLGVEPMLGRNISAEEDQTGADGQMILSYGLWTRRFHSDRNIVGRTVQVNGHACTIIGVMPEGFDFPMRIAATAHTPSQHMDFWATMGMRSSHPDAVGVGFGAVARLRSGVAPAQAEEDLRAISARLDRGNPRAGGDRILHQASLRARSLRSAESGLLLLMAAVTVFMLIGCANIANLLLARALSRHRELAVRMAMGAGRARIIRQMVTESCVLAALGGLLGYALAAAAWTVLPAVAPMSIPRLSAARADVWVLLFTLAVALLNGILFGIVPALRAASRDPAAALRDSGTRGSLGGSSTSMRSALVIAEVALAMMLVAIGGLLTGSFIRLLRTDPGFQADRVLASIIIAAGDQYREPAAKGLLYRHIVDAVRALPGVEAAGTVDALPFTGENHGGFVRAGSPDSMKPEEVAEVNVVSADYLPALGVPLVQGRGFREDDMAAGRDVAIVNDVAAARLWPGQDPVGQRICLFCSEGYPQNWKQVVGVVKTIRHAALEEPPAPEIYTAAQALERAQFLVVRTARPSPDLALAIRRAVAAVDPNQPVFLSASMSTLIGDSIADRRFIMTLLAATSCLALLLAVAGVYGVLSYTTSRRTQEIGVRIALGAAPRQIHGLIFRHGMTLAITGVALGLLSALALTRFLRAVLLGLTGADPLLIAMAAVLVIAAAMVACWIPARRATRIDPMAALREE